MSEENKCCFHCWKCKHHCEDYGCFSLWRDISNIPCTIEATIWNNVIEPLSAWKAQRHKRVYRCWICGRLFAPKFYDEGWGSGLSLINCGWEKIHAPFMPYKYDRYICHHCEGHGFSRSDDTRDIFERGYNWDEWQDEVDKHNKKLLTTIKEKDPEYFNSYVKEYGWLFEKYGLE